MGIIEKSKEVDLSIIQGMQKLLVHRGPNDSGLENFNFSRNDSLPKNIAIGFDRLSIRDLSSAGHQPMLNESGDILIAFNGEIYNSEDYRSELTEKGCVFKGHSDTEIILYLYQIYGIDEMLTRLDGMFAICIVDFIHSCMYLIRDRLGEKPLYLYRADDLFLFASEYKSFYAHPNFKAIINKNAVNEYFLFRYVSGGETMLENVVNMTPGTYLKINENGFHNQVYWKMPEHKSNADTFEKNKERLKSLLYKSVKRRMVSDVPVGLQLSGGVDSSYLASIVKEYSSDKLHTFGTIFKEAIYTEEKWMDQVNRKYDFVPHKFYFSSDLFFKTWKETTYFFEAPANHEGTCCIFHLNKKAKDFVTVMLCGEGADESLAGYDRYSYLSHILLHKSQYDAKQLIKKCLSRYVKKYYRVKGVQNYSLDCDFISATQWIDNQMFFNLLGSPNQLEQVYKKRLNIIKETQSQGLRRYINYDMKTYMQDLLMRADKVSLASSIEVRVPFLMPELIEFEAQVPEDQLASFHFNKASHNTKRLLKSLSEDIFGKEFTYRDKIGLWVPIITYMQNEEVRNFIETQLLPGIRKRKIINYDYLYKLWTEAMSKRTDRPEVNMYHAIWMSLSFELWAQMYIDSKPQHYIHCDIS